MLAEVSLFGALAPSALIYLLAALALFLAADRVASWTGMYHFLWHPPLVRVGLFLLLFSGLAALW